MEYNPQEEQQDTSRAELQRELLQMQVEEEEAEAAANSQQSATVATQVPQQEQQQQAQENSPFKNEDGTIDYDKINRYGAEQDMDTLAAVGDFAVGTLNFVANRFGFDNPVPEIPKFENELAQGTRDIQATILPMLAIQTAAVGGISKIPAVANNPALTATAPRVIGTNAVNLGTGAFVGAVTPQSREDNFSGTLKSSMPRAFGWLPDWLATNEADSPDDKMRKNVLEGIVLDSTMGIYEAASAAFRKSDAGAQLFNWVPGSEKADGYFDANLPRATPEEAREYYMDTKIAEAPDESMHLAYQSALKSWDRMGNEEKKQWRNIANNNSPQARLNGVEQGQREALDELGQYNISKRVEAGNLDFDEPVFGVHDLYGYRESGIRQLDSMGVVGASVDAVRIVKNIDSINGRLGNMVSDAVIKLSNDSSQMVVDDVTRGLAGELKAADRYGYVTNTGQKIEFEDITEVGDLLASNLYGQEVEEMAAMLEPFLGSVRESGARVLNKEGAAAVEKVMKKYRADYLDPDLMRAKGYLSTSLAGQVADTSQGVRLMEGTEAYKRGAEQVLDRLEFLMNLKAGTDMEKANAIRLSGIFKQLNTFGPQAIENKEIRRSLSRWQEAKAAGDQGMEAIRQDTARTISTMRAIANEQPELLKPFLFAYEATDGNIRSINALNRFFKESTAIWRKAFVDMNPDVPSVYNKAFWGNIYNSALSAIGTPIKAAYSGSALLIERPIAAGVGAIRTGDTESLRRAWYMYSGAMDTLTNGIEYAKRVWRKSALDPYGAQISVRENINDQDMVQLDIMRQLAAAKSLQGEDGAQVLVNMIEEMMDMANNPVLRMGTRSMSSFDGFIQAVVGNWEARGRAFDQLSNNGKKALTRENVGQLSKKVYADMFDETGLMTDKAVKYAAGELAFNLDSGYSDGLNKILEYLPGLKPFMMFTKTPMNAAAFTASSNPLGLFFNQLNKFKLPYDQMDGAVVEQLLKERGVRFTPSTVKAEYSQIRNEMIGRKAIGMSAAMLGSYMFMNDRIRGDGLYDAQKQALRRDSNWAPRTYKGWDGKWYSYEGLGAISDYIAFMANVFDNGLDVDAMGKSALGTSQDLGEYIRATGFVLGAAVTDKSYLANLEPLMDVLRGDPGAVTRWSSGFLNSAVVPGANAVNEFYGLLDSNKRIVEKDLISRLSSRTPLKAAMPIRYDWISGDPVGEPTNFWTRLWNRATPWKQSDSVSPEKQYLMDIGYDGRAIVQTNGKGVTYTADQQSEILSYMGKKGYFRDAIIEVMESKPAKQFKKQFQEARRMNLDPDLATYDMLHSTLDKKLRIAMKRAQDELSTAGDVNLQGYARNQVERNLKLGNNEEALKTLQQFR